MHFSNVFIRKISRSSNRIAELKIFIYLHCQHLLNVYYVPRTIISAWYIVFLLPRFSCLINHSKTSTNLEMLSSFFFFSVNAF